MKGEGAFSEYLAREFERRFAQTRRVLGSWEQERHRYEELAPDLDVLERRYRAWYERTRGALTEPVSVSIWCVFGYACGRA